MKKSAGKNHFHVLLPSAMKSCEDAVVLTVQPCRSPLSPSGGLHMPTQYPVERQMKEINNATGATEELRVSF